MFNCTELVSSCLYDETMFRPSDERISRVLFCAPTGSYSPQDGKDYKSFLRTNMLLAGQLPSPTRFRVDRLNVLFCSKDRPLRLFETDMYRNCFVRFSIMCKRYWESPAWLSASPFALFDSPKSEIEAMKKNYGIDWPRVGASFQSPHELLIGTMECFDVQIECIRPVREEIFCVVHLDGVEERSIV